MKEKDFSFSLAPFSAKLCECVKLPQQVSLPLLG